MIYSNDAFTYPYTSSRVATFARKGMVATSQPLAASIGLDILKKGGNAVDAAVATAAALTVVEPSGCGIGGDAFALVWINEKLYGLNASSTAPEALTPEIVAEHGFDKLPPYGWLPVTVPGVPLAWAELNERFGKLSFSEVLQPAVDLAFQGFPVSPTISLLWKRAVEDFDKNLQDPVLRKSWFEAFAPDGKAPNPGDLFVSESLGKGLLAIMESQSKSFYHGELAQKIEDFSRQTGGLIRGTDLAAYKSLWIEPIRLNYRGYDIWQIPPNSQGLVLLMALNILRDFDFDQRDSIETYHRQVEALKLAYTDGHAFITQLEHMPYSPDELLAEDFAAQRRTLICERALNPGVGKPAKGGTVYLATADNDGNMVSFIQSSYDNFGSGVVVPNTGISLQNRGIGFSLNPKHPNYLQPGKRTFHTLMPGFITQNDMPIGPFCVMGAYMQPQGQLQVISNMIDFGMNPQAALDCPRWQWFGGQQIGLERNTPETIIAGMRAKGHQVKIDTDLTNYGRGQIIIRNPQTGVLCGGTEKRTDGSIACY